jgi:hypothetical protein
MTTNDTTTITSDMQTLEQLIDRHGLQSVLQLLGEVCDEKGAHIVSTWQDKQLAKHWQNAASVVLNASEHVRIRAVSK